MESGTARYTGPLMVLLCHVSGLPYGASADSCSKCYQLAYLGDVQAALIQTHVYLDPACFDSSKLKTCEDNGRTYWLAENLGTYEQWSGGECPEAERWVCFERNLGEGIIENRMYPLNMIREQVVIQEKPTTSPRPVSDNLIIPELDKNLFVDLVEKISKELNVTNCWVCGGTLMTDMWPL